MYSRQVAFMRLGDTSHMSCWAVAASPRTLGSSSALCSFARLDRVVCTAFFSGREDMLFCQQTAVGTLIRGPLCSRNSALLQYFSRPERMLRSAVLAAGLVASFAVNHTFLVWGDYGTGSALLSLRL